MTGPFIEGLYCKWDTISLVQLYDLLIHKLYCTYVHAEAAVDQSCLVKHHTSYMWNIVLQFAANLSPDDGQHTCSIFKYETVHRVLHKKWIKNCLRPMPHNCRLGSSGKRQDRLAWRILHQKQQIYMVASKICKLLSKIAIGISTYLISLWAHAL